MKPPHWSVYLVRDNAGHLYTGAASDVARRFAEHCSGGTRSARRLRGRAPLELVFACPVGDKQLALRLEHRIKKLSKAHKEALVAKGAASLEDWLSQTPDAPDTLKKAL